jgi:hypothetical protein
LGTKEVTVLITDSSISRVVQAIEPEAARLLTEKGGKISRFAFHGMYYCDYQPYEDQHLLSWPAGTLSAYISSHGQEDTTVIFAVFLLPGCRQELHLVYDYRLLSPAGPFEEYFTLQISRENEFVLSQVLRPYFVG